MDIEDKKIETDSDDEVQTYNDQLSFSFKPEKSSPLELLSVSKIKVETLFVGTLGNGSTYLTAKKLDNMSSLGYIYEKTLKLAEIFGTPDNKTLFIIFEDVVPSSVYFEFSKFLFEKFDIQHVVLIDSIHPNLLGGFPKDEVELPTLRYIHTTHVKGDNLPGKKLEKACPLRGLAADILIYCEMNGIPAIDFLLITTEHEVFANDLLLYENVAGLYKELSKPTDRKTLGSLASKTNLRSSQVSCYL